MATTTNYGWTTPDDTALVKDGAAAIRTLGSSVDTTTKNLNPETTLGDIAYRSSTANVKTRLGIGSTGDILTVAGGVPSWAAPAPAASGLTLIGTTTFTAVSSTNVNNVFSTTYNNYKVIIVGAGTSSGVDISMKLRVGGADTSANYATQEIYSTGASVDARSNVLGTDEIFLGTLAAPANKESPVIFDIVSPFLTTHTGLCAFDFNSGGPTLRIIGGGHIADTSFTGFTLIYAGSSTGTISVYGYQK